MNYENIGNLISELRKEKGLTQKELAEQLMVTDRAVSKWERGRGCPNISLLDDLSRILDISVIEILKGRRLDKDEITDNKDLIETMTFTEENLQFKIKDSIVKCLLFLASILIALVFYVNLRVYIAENLDYKISPLYSSDLVDVEIHKTRKDIILNNQGNYTDEEYFVIVDYVKKSSDILEAIDLERYISKWSVDYEEIEKIVFLISDYNYSVMEERVSLYDVLIKRNPEYLEEILRNESAISSNSVGDNLFDLRDLDVERYSSCTYGLNRIYEVDNSILNKIIKEGEMND